MRLWFGHRFCVIQYLLQEDHADEQHIHITQVGQGQSAVLLVKHGVSLDGAHMGIL